MRWMILCNDCCEKLDPEDLVGIFEAKFGLREGEDIECSVLACALWSERVPDENEAVWQFFCDECGAAVAVAESSQWFIESHRQERDEQIGRT